MADGGLIEQSNKLQQKHIQVESLPDQKIIKKRCISCAFYVSFELMVETRSIELLVERYSTNI